MLLLRAAIISFNLQLCYHFYMVSQMCIRDSINIGITVLCCHLTTMYYFLSLLVANILFYFTFQTAYPVDVELNTNLFSLLCQTDRDINQSSRKKKYVGLQLISKMRLRCTIVNL